MCSLVMAKSRVTPVKVVSIHRLELAAAVLSCKVSKLLNADLCIDDLHNIYWCDSQIVLAYISNEAKRFHVYVANRVQTIRSYSSVDSWRYVPTEVNPADDSSRGINVDKLVDINDCRWFKGPAFLYQKDIPDFPLHRAGLDKGDPELRAVCFVSTSEYATDLLDRLSYFSSWFKAKRAVANSILIIQFWHAKCKNKNAKLPVCTVPDLQRAEILMIKEVQVSHFKDEVSCLKGGTIVNCNSKLFVLCPIIDDKGVMRVGGRLDHASTLSYIEKHPIVMPRAKDCKVSKLIITHYHEKCLHQGRGVTVNTIRSNGFWILALVSSVASVIYKCITCRKLYRHTMEQQMTLLPSDRVEESPPFTFSAVDIFGPYSVKNGRKVHKRYAVLFTCMSCRAVHIEVAFSLTTDSFINAYRRFVSIRGKVNVLRSDCGTNFIGAEREIRHELDGIDNNKVRAHLMKDACDFKFNVPSASHAGGVWERQIRSVR